MKKTIIYISIAISLIPHFGYAAFRIVDNNSRMTTVTSPQLFGSLFSTAISDFVMSFSPVITQVSPSSTSTVIIKEVNYDAVTASDTTTTCLVTASNGAAGTYTSANPSIATVNSSGNTTRVSDGTVEIIAHYGQRWRAVYCPISLSHNTPTNFFNRFVDNSFSSTSASFVNAAILGKTPSDTTQANFSALNDTTHVYTRNTSIFTGSLNLTAIPVFSDVIGGSRLLSGILISPDIMLYAAHAAKVPVGGHVYFVGNDNVTVDRTILSYTAVDQTGGYNDLYIGRLSSVVSANITPAKLAPSNMFTTKVTPTGGSTLRSPVIYYRSQTRSMYIGSFKATSLSSGGGISFQIPPPESGYTSWFTTPIIGDSASPVFMMGGCSGVIPILQGTLYGPTSPSGVWSNLTLITNAITTAGGQQYTTADLSTCNSY